MSPAEIAATAQMLRDAGMPYCCNRWLALTPEALAENERRRIEMAKIGPKEAQRAALRESKMTGREARSATARAMVAAVDGPKKVEPPATPAEESGVSKKAKKKAAAPRAKAKAKPPKAKAAAPKKTAAKPGVDRSPLTVGTFITRPGGCTMAELEKKFRMDAHPLRSKIHAAKHKLGFAIEYDAKEKRYTGQAPLKTAAE